VGIEDLSVTLRRERNEGRCKMMTSEKKAVEIGRLTRLKSFVGDR